MFAGEGRSQDLSWSPGPVLLEYLLPEMGYAAVQGVAPGNTMEV